MFRYLSIFSPNTKKVIFHHALEAANPWAERGTAPARKIFQALLGPSSYIATLDFLTHWLNFKL